MTKTDLVVIQERQAAIQIVAKMGAKAVGNLLKRIIMLSILQILSVNPPIVFWGVSTFTAMLPFICNLSKIFAI